MEIPLNPQSTDSERIAALENRLELQGETLHTLQQAMLRLSQAMMAMNAQSGPATLIDIRGNTLVQ